MNALVGTGVLDGPCRVKYVAVGADGVRAMNALVGTGVLDGPFSPKAKILRKKDFTAFLVLTVLKRL